MGDVAPRHHASATRSARGRQAAPSPNTVADQDVVRVGTPRGLEGPPSEVWLAGRCVKLHSPRRDSLDIHPLGGLRPLIPAHVLNVRARIIHPRASSHLAALDPRLRRRRRRRGAGTLRRSPLLLACLALCSRSRWTRALRSRGSSAACAGLDARADTRQLAWAPIAARADWGRRTPLRCDATAHWARVRIAARIPAGYGNSNRHRASRRWGGILRSPRWAAACRRIPT